MRSAKVTANAFNAGFHRVIHRACPRPLGSSPRVTRYRHLSAACSVGKCPRAPTALRYLALRLSIALVENRTRRISTSYARNGVNCSHAAPPDLRNGGVGLAPLLLELLERGPRGLGAGSGVDRPQVACELVPVLA